MVNNKEIDVLLLSRCCGKGFKSVKELLKHLDILGIKYRFFKVSSKDARNIFTKYGLNPREREPYVLINEILIKASSITKNWIESLAKQLKATVFQDSINTGSSFLSGIVKK